MEERGKDSYGVSRWTKGARKHLPAAVLRFATGATSKKYIFNFVVYTWLARIGGRMRGKLVGYQTRVRECFTLDQK